MDIDARLSRPVSRRPPRGASDGRVAGASDGRVGGATLSVWSERRLELIAAALLGIAVIVAFAEVRTHGFINYDDQDYVTENPIVQNGLTLEGLRWAFTTSHASNWFPLTWLSHMLDFELFGANPGAHHAVSLLLHLFNTLALLAVLRRMTGQFWRSLLVAALFGLHPLRVESVAWAAERKDVLSAAFWMLALFGYARWVERPSTPRYLAVFLLMAAGLMAKPMLVTLPFALLLLDYWPLRRLAILEPAASGADHPGLGPGAGRRSLGAALLEKVPLLVLSAAASAVTFLVQRSWGAVSEIEQLPLALRLTNVVVAYAGYLWKMVWPARLRVFYPLRLDLSMAEVAAAALVLVALSALAVAKARRAPYLPVGWFWYLGTLVPVIGIVQVGSQAMADRYTYLPLIGIFIALAWAIPDWSTLPLPRRLLAAAPIASLLLALAIATRLEVRHWRDSSTLFEHTLGIDPSNYIAHGCLALAEAGQGRTREAVEHYRAALCINPRFSVALKNLGPALQADGRLEEAVAHYREGLSARPNDPDLLNNFAWLRATSARPELRSGAEAVQLAKLACELTRRSNPTMLDTLAAAYAEAGGYDDAIRAADEGIHVALASGQHEVARLLRERRELYRARRPYREPPPAAR